MREIETIVTFLEMTAEPLHHIAPPSSLKLMLMRAENITLSFYRFLYDTVGRDYNWDDRSNLSDLELANLIHAEDVEVWVLYVGGQPAGYFELVPNDASTIELEYFGLMPEFQGKGLGNWLLAEAIRAAWAKLPKRVIVQTCTLDGPAALPLYQKMGFTPYAQEPKTMEIPD
jgi:GNAT superfamily N-acetyltransferase